jgi:thermitase
MVMSPLRFLLPVGVVLAIAIALAIAPDHSAASPSRGAAPAVAQHVPDAVLVKFRPGISSAVVSEAAVQHHVARMKPLPGLGVMEMRLSPSAERPEGRRGAEAQPNVEFAELDYIVSTVNTPNDPTSPVASSGTWPKCRRRTPGTHDGQRERVRRRLDTGVDLSHPDLREGSRQRELH